MSIELKLCPFCGGAAGIERAPDFPHDTYTVGCSRCAAMMGGRDGDIAIPTLYDSEEDAAEAWNRRAERTCEMELLPYADDDRAHRWLRERCSACGEVFESDNFEIHGAGQMEFRFCPECGAKVVDA